MSDAAQGEPLRHEVFTSPFQVTPQFEMWKTPGNYRSGPGGENLPEQLKVWRVQNTGKNSGSVVSRPDVFDGFPDAEILAPGYNIAKQNGSPGVSRHGNFLQWGFSAPPSQMTDAGRKFLVNCISYIRKFDGRPPLVRVGKVSARTRAAAIVATMKQLSKLAPPVKYGQSDFPPDIQARYQNDLDGLDRYYRDNIEFVIHDGRNFRVDDEVRSLGLDSNRKPETLAKLIALLNDPEKAGAARTLLSRYTTQSFQEAGQWRNWLAAGRGRIFFTDVGGYKFVAIPEGYLDEGRRPDPAARR
jgi:hypothetical protein